MTQERAPERERSLVGEESGLLPGTWHETVSQIPGNR
jgi:hypothetical protein